MEISEKKFGIPLDFSSYRGRINPDFYQTDFLEKLRQFDQLLQGSSHQILFDGRNRLSVIPFPVAEGKTINIVVKEFFARGLNRAKTIFLPSKAQKAWWGGVALMTREISTPVPVAYLEKKPSLFVDEGVYLSVLEEGVEEIRYLFLRLSQAELFLLVQALAHHLQCCHKKGILHRDLSDGNILVKKNALNERTFFLIDTNRIRVKKRIGILRRIKNLSRLGVPPVFQRPFLEKYVGLGRLKKWVWFWYRTCKNTYDWHIRLKKGLYLGREIKPGNSD
jgi:hypothetical protein